MGFNEEEFNQAKSKMLGEFNKAITDAAELREAEREAFDMSSEAARAAIAEKSPDAGTSEPAVPGPLPDTP